jgi:hypothetical protein
LPSVHRLRRHVYTVATAWAHVNRRKNA